MNISLTNEEKQHPEFLKHRFVIRQIWLKIILMAIIIVAGSYFGNMLIESYKTKETVSQFMLEKRLAALTEIRVAYNDLCECLQKTYNCNLEQLDKNIIKKTHEDHKSNISDFVKIVNKWSLLFPESFSQRIGAHSIIHKSIAGKTVELCKEHIPFQKALFQNFDHFTRVALIEGILGKTENPPKGLFFFDKKSMSRLNVIESDDFFTMNFDKWKKEHPQEKPTQP